MTKLELVEKAINFAMSDLCDGYLDMPCGCEGCPLWNESNMDDDGNVDCRGKILREFIEQHKDEFKHNEHSGKWIQKKKWQSGRWIKWFECSVCGEQDNNYDMYVDMPFCNLSNYCPNCGAIMNEEV